MKSSVISDDVIRARLPQELPSWALMDGALERTYKTNGWKSTLMVVNAIGHLAEAAWHHPDIHASWPSVKVRLNTHDSGGITEKDFALATQIEKMITWRPGSEGGALEGTPDDPRYAYILPDA
jgi:4a-hydroxytetrahydrobiopterin dehydratase